MRVGKRGVDYEELSILNYNGVEKTYKEEKDSNDKV
jgi:hypothetical protein